MTLTTPPVRTAGPTPLAPRRRRTAAVAAAGALATAAAAVGVFALGTTGDDAAPDQLTPADRPAETVLDGLRGVPDFPVRMTVPPALREVDEDAGSRAFEVEGGGGGVILTAVRSIGGTQVAALPEDLVPLLDARPDVVVSDAGERSLGGVTGQAFTLSVPAGEEPRDLWCPVVEPLCFKLDADKPADVVVLPTAAGPLWVLVEATPAAREAVDDAAADLLATLQITPAVEVPGTTVTFRLPTGWVAEYVDDGFVHAGEPARRSSASATVVVPARVLAADGTEQPAPADLLGWLTARDGLEVRTVGGIEVDGRAGTLVRVDADAAQEPWCGSDFDNSCVRTSAGTTLYGLVPFDGGTLVLDSAWPGSTDGVSDDEVTDWAEAMRQLATRITLG